MNKKKTTTDALTILHHRYYVGKPERLAALEEARANDSVARKIAVLREEAGLSQRQLAKLIGTTASVICRLENAEYEGHSLAMKSLNDAINEVHKNIANSATADLKYIYENSEWYSAKYMAGQAIGMDKELISKLPRWASSLKESFGATKIEHKQEETFEMIEVDMTPRDGMGWKYEDVPPSYEYRSTGWRDVAYEVPDYQKRQDAVRDAIELYTMSKPQLFDRADDPKIRAFLAEIYTRSVGRTELTAIGVEIGKALGFSPLTVHLKVRILPALKICILPVVKWSVLLALVGLCVLGHRWSVLLALVGFCGFGLYKLGKYFYFW